MNDEKNNHKIKQQKEEGAEIKKQFKTAYVDRGKRFKSSKDSKEELLKKKALNYAENHGTEEELVASDTLDLDDAQAENLSGFSGEEDEEMTTTTSSSSSHRSSASKSAPPNLKALLPTSTRLETRDGGALKARNPSTQELKLKMFDTMYTVGETSTNLNELIKIRLRKEQEQ